MTAFDTSVLLVPSFFAMSIPLPTPPSTNPGSPRSPSSSTNDVILKNVDKDADIEKQTFNNEKCSYLNDDSPDCQDSKLIITGIYILEALTPSLGPPKYSLHRRFSEYVRSLSVSEKLSHIPGTWRRNKNGSLEKDFQKSKEIVDHVIAFVNRLITRDS